MMFYLETMIVGRNHMLFYISQPQHLAFSEENVSVHENVKKLTHLQINFFLRCFTFFLVPYIFPEWVIYLAIWEKYRDIKICIDKREKSLVVNFFLRFSNFFTQDF